MIVMMIAFNERKIKVAGDAAQTNVIPTGSVTYGDICWAVLLARPVTNVTSLKFFLLSNIV